MIIWVSSFVHVKIEITDALNNSELECWIGFEKLNLMYNCAGYEASQVEFPSENCWMPQVLFNRPKSPAPFTDVGKPTKVIQGDTSSSNTLFSQE